MTLPVPAGSGCYDPEVPHYVKTGHDYGTHSMVPLAGTSEYLAFLHVSAWHGTCYSVWYAPTMTVGQAAERRKVANPMARLIRLIVAVAAENLADIVDHLTEAGATVTMSGNVADMASAMTGADVDADTETRISRKVRARAAVDVEPVKRARRANPNAGKTVLYTPAGTKMQIAKTLANLRGGTMAAFVYSDLMAHPGSRNAEVRERLSKKAAKAGLSVESVDNVIWQQVNKGLLKKEVQAE